MSASSAPQEPALAAAAPDITSNNGSSSAAPQEASVDAVATAAAESALDASIAATLAGLEPSESKATGSGGENVGVEDVKPDVAMKQDSADPTLASTAVPENGSGEAQAASRNGSVQPDFLESVPGSPSPATASANAVPSPTKAKPAKPTAGLSRLGQLNARIEKDPLDTEAQLALIADAEQKGDLERTREVYESFLKVFPDAAKQWIAYCDLELSHGFFERVQDIFIRCLRPSCSVALWKFYLDFVRRRNPIDHALPEQAKQARATITKSFEFALSHIGQAREAGEVWLEYIEFLKEGGNRGTWEDQQKMDNLRKTYQRAVQIPLNNVEQIWQEYNSFENNLSKMTAKRFVSELSPAYMTARKVLRELRAQFDDLAQPDLPERPDWNDGARGALDQWRRYLAYEESNPLDIEEQPVLQQRVGFAYKKAVAYLRFFSEVWYLAANYNLKLGNADEARILLHTGLVANPTSLLLAYTLAELEEGRGEFEACYKIFDNLIEHAHTELAQLQTATEQEIADAMETFDAKASATEGANGDEDGERTVQEKEEVKAAISKRREGEVEAVKKRAASVWIVEMRFARRAEGIKQARQVFTKARKAPSLTWQIVEASATMEFYWNNEPKVATNVFELGLRHFSKEPAFVLQYLKYLIMTNNPNNARALFERTVALVEPEKAKAVWDCMAGYEYQYGDSLAAQKMFTRYAEAFPQKSASERFAQRYAQIGLEDVILRDIGLEITASRSSRHRSRSASPRRGKRGASVEAASADVQQGENKRFKPNPEGSPAPSSSGGGGGGGGGERRSRWGPAVVPSAAVTDDSNGAPAQQQQRPNRLESKHAPALNRPIPFMLDPRGDNVAVLPDAVVFFLSILPPAIGFSGPRLNPATLVDLIGNTLLPGTAPGPGLPGERLGIPPRPKPDAGGGGGGGGPPGGGRRPLSPPPRFGGPQDGGYGQRRGGGGMGGGGRRY